MAPVRHHDRAVGSVHGWALEHRHLGPRMSAQDYATHQSDLVLASLRAAP